LTKTRWCCAKKEERIAEKEQILNAKVEQIATLENLLRESKEQNEQLNASLAQNKELTGALQVELADERSKVQFLTQKLFTNKQMMRRVYKEFSTFIDDVDNEESPVIPLRPEYGNTENEEAAVQ
jgi:hypothetical protein